MPTTGTSEPTNRTLWISPAAGAGAGGDDGHIAGWGRLEGCHQVASQRTQAVKASQAQLDRPPWSLTPIPHAAGDGDRKLTAEEEEARRIAEMGKPVLGENCRLEVIIEESYDFKVIFWGLTFLEFCLSCFLGEGLREDNDESHREGQPRVQSPPSRSLR